LQRLLDPVEVPQERAVGVGIDAVVPYRGQVLEGMDFSWLTDC
jgi:hypothetical protein